MNIYHKDRAPVAERFCFLFQRYNTPAQKRTSLVCASPCQMGYFYGEKFPNFFPLIIAPLKLLCQTNHPWFLFVLRFYDPVNPVGSCRAWSVYWAGLVLLVVNQYRAHSIARNWQLPFLNQWKGENDHRKYFKNVAGVGGVEPATSWSPVGCASSWAIKAS